MPTSKANVEHIQGHGFLRFVGACPNIVDTEIKGINYSKNAAEQAGAVKGANGHLGGVESGVMVKVYSGLSAYRLPHIIQVQTHNIGRSAGQIMSGHSLEKSFDLGLINLLLFDRTKQFLSVRGGIAFGSFAFQKFHRANI